MEKSLDRVKENYARIVDEIGRAASSCGRDPASVQLMAVTKTQPPELVNQAIARGARLLGENRAQELLEKYDFYRKDGVSIHFIGHLQTNKVRQIIDKVDMIHSVHTAKLAAEINRQAAKIGRVMDVLIEVNIGREESKSGVLPEEAEPLAREIAALGHLRLRGFMAIPPIANLPEENEPFFSQMQQLSVDIKGKKLDNSNIDTLSMGMSGDFAAAVKYGSTIVRIGTALFGERNYSI